MGEWKCIKIRTDELYSFSNHLNKCIVEEYDKTYFKIFTPKSKELKNKLFYIADEGSPVIKALSLRYELIACSAPEKKLVSKVGGFTVDRAWMFGQ